VCSCQEHTELHISIRIEEWRSQNHSTLTLPLIAWRKVVSLTHGMTNGSTQQQTCYRIMSRKKSAAWYKHVRLHWQEQTENKWLLSLIWWFWIMQSFSTWLVTRIGPSWQINIQGVWSCKLPIDTLPPQLLAMSPDLMSALSKPPRQYFSTSVAG